jgi:predicted Rossmann fold flavoprotein
MAAGVAGQRGRRVLVIDHADQPGKKILISGGGRCNFTNLGAAPDRYLSANPHFIKSALRRYTAQDFLELVERHRIAWHEKTLGQLFCDGSARQIVAMLMEECAKGAVRISLGRPIREVEHADGKFRVDYGNEVAEAPALVIATGGPSIPRMGATGFAYDLARKFGLKVVEPGPALVPLTLGGEEALFRDLSGVATEVVASAGTTRFREAALFTHRACPAPPSSRFLPIGVTAADRHRLSSRGRRQAGRWPPSANARGCTSIRCWARRLPGRLAEALSKRIGLWG